MTLANCTLIARRPSAFQAGHIPSWHKLCERYALSPVIAACHRLLLLLSPLLSFGLGAWDLGALVLVVTS
jgi:hypothetical protein